MLVSLPHIMLSILVVTYRTPELTCSCVESIYANPPDVAFEVLIFDNDPSDGTTQLLSERFPEGRLFPSEDNLGFAAANNELARHAVGDYVLLLNSDTLVHAGSLQALIDFAIENPGGGLYGGRTVRASGELEPSSCWGQQTLWSVTCFAACLSYLFRGNRVLDPESLGAWQRDSVREVGVVTGCLALMRRDLWNRMDGFDERFWMYGEDSDLTIRVRSLGYRPVVTPDATITHFVGASSTSSGSKIALVLQSRATLMRKHWSGHRASLGSKLLLSGCFLRHRLSRADSGWTQAWLRRDEWILGFSEHRDPIRRPVSELRSRTSNG